MNARAKHSAVLVALFTLTFSAWCAPQAPNLKPMPIIQPSELIRRAHAGEQVTADGAVIRGSLDLSYLEIGQQVSLTNCDFQDAPDFSYTTFKRHLVLTGS